jgi:hypothetical protein
MQDLSLTYTSILQTLKDWGIQLQEKFGKDICTNKLQWFPI